MPVPMSRPMSLKTAPMKVRASCSLQTISALRYLTATTPLARSTEKTAPGPAQPDAPIVLGGQWISTGSPTSKRPSSVAR
eukprot:2110557-Pyramimonas_sp.AAC.1